MEFAILGAVSAGVYVCWRRISDLEKKVHEILDYLGHPYEIK